MIKIETLGSKEMEVFSKSKESQLYHYNEPELGFFVAESKNVILRALAAGYQPVRLLIETKVMDTPDGREVLKAVGEAEIYCGDEELLKQLTGYNLTCGLLCCFKRKPLPEVSQLIKDASRIVVLEKVVNPTNLGAIFRNAAALNMDAVLLTEDCCDPLYKRSSRVAMGNVFNIPYTYIDQAQDVKQYGFKTVGMALRHNTIPIDDPVLQEVDKLAVLLGSEGPGLREETIEACDYVVKIPMSHEVDSLNVAAASAIAFWQLQKR